jgi:hypothetical protein
MAACINNIITRKLNMFEILGGLIISESAEHVSHFLLRDKAKVCWICAYARYIRCSEIDEVGFLHEQSKQDSNPRAMSTRVHG